MRDLGIEHFLQQAEFIASLIRASDPYGPLGEERERNRQLAEAGFDGGWTIDCYRNWWAGFLRCARRCGMITPLQETDFYDVVQSAAEHVWLLEEQQKAQGDHP